MGGNMDGPYKTGVRTSPQTYQRSRLRLEGTQAAVSGPADPVSVLRAELLGESVEVVAVVAVDGNGLVRDYAEVARGGYHSVMVPIPPLLAVPILAGCDYAVIAHTHPSGRLLPSNHDYDMTKTIAIALANVGIVLQDHLIFGPDGRHMSFRDAHVLEVPEPQILEVQA